MSSRTRKIALICAIALLSLCAFINFAAQASTATQDVGGGYLSTEVTSTGTLVSIDYEADRITLTQVDGTALRDGNTDNGTIVVSAAIPSLLSRIQENETSLIGSEVEITHSPMPHHVSCDGELAISNMRLIGGDWLL